jgi:hypothetical protein
MQIEFFSPNPGCFSGTTFFRELGSDKYHTLDSLDSNKQKLIYLLLMDNKETRKYIVYLNAKGIKDETKVLEMVIIKFFGRLDPIWDIDGNKLNFDGKHN